MSGHSRDPEHIYNSARGQNNRLLNEGKIDQAEYNRRIENAKRMRRIDRESQQERQKQAARAAAATGGTGAATSECAATYPPDHAPAATDALIPVGLIVATAVAVLVLRWPRRRLRHRKI